MAPILEVSIREFRTGDEAAFRRLNEEWIRRYFVMEPKDETSFANPQETILNDGGKIFLAVIEEQPVGCCALRAMAPSEFEIVKMAVTQSCQRGGIGRLLLQKTIAEGFALGAHRLYLETNHGLPNAIRLYESEGFRHIPPERILPSPYARADVYMELFIQR